MFAKKKKSINSKTIHVVNLNICSGGCQAKKKFKADSIDWASLMLTLNIFMRKCKPSILIPRKCCVGVCEQNDYLI